MDSMLGSRALSNTSVSGIWDCHLIQGICRRHRWWKRSRVGDSQRQHFTWILEGLQNEYFINHGLYCKFDAKQCPNTFFKTRKGSKIFFNTQRNAVVKNASLNKRAAKINKKLHHVQLFSIQRKYLVLLRPIQALDCAWKVFFGLISKRKLLDACSERFIKTCILFSECLTTLRSSA